MVSSWNTQPLKIFLQTIWKLLFIFFTIVNAIQIQEIISKSSTFQGEQHAPASEEKDLGECYRPNFLFFSMLLTYHVTVVASLIFSVSCSMTFPSLKMTNNRK